MNITDRKKMADLMSQFKKFNGNNFKVLSVDIKNDLELEFLEGYELQDEKGDHYCPMIVSDPWDKDGGLMFLDRIHEIQVLTIEYILISKENNKKYHVYSGCSIKTYPGEKGTCFLNFRDKTGEHIKGIPIDEILTVDYNEEQKSIVVTFNTKKPAFRYSWLETK